MSQRDARLTLDPKKKTHIRCSRFRSAGESKRALALADESLLDIKATQWFKGAKAFAEKAVAAGSARAAFFVGSVAFYCEGSDGFFETSHEDTHNDPLRCSSETEEERRRDARRARGASLLARAATAGVKEAHHTLAVMHFNGSGGRRRDKDPEAGARFVRAREHFVRLRLREKRARALLTGRLRRRARLCARRRSC
jgi:hypothetical protein